MPWLAFENGCFSSYLSVLFSADPVAGTATVVGKGDALFATTCLNDIARFVALAFQKLPASELHNRKLQVVGKNTTVNQLFQNATKKNGKAWNIKYTSVKEAKETSADMSKGMEAFMAWLNWAIESGSGQLSRPDNDRLGFKPLEDPVDDLLK
jgi:hypothetical protein